jgi:hypothetical protein
MKINLFKHCYILILAYFLSSVNANGQVHEYKVKPGAFEIINMRTLNSKTFQNPDGTQTIAISTSNIHQMDVYGMLSDISNSDEITLDPITAQVNNPLEAGVKLQSGNYERVLGNNAGLLFNRVERCYKYWPISIIPSGLNITDAYFILDPIANINNYDPLIIVNSIETDPFLTSTTPESIFKDIANLTINNSSDGGVTYYSDNFNNQQNITIQGDANFINNLEAALNNTFPYFAVGIKVGNESSADHFMSFHPGTILYVTYEPTSLPDYKLVMYGHIQNFTKGYSTGPLGEIMLGNGVPAGNNDIDVQLTILGSPAPSWLSVNPTQLTVNNTGFPFRSFISVQNNYSMQIRTAVIKVESVYPPPPFVQNGIQYSYVTQHPIRFWTSPAIIDNYHYSGGTIPIEVYSSWTYNEQEYFNVSSNNSWISTDITSGLSRIDDINLTIEPNNSTSIRTGSITISGNNIVPYDLIITQDIMPSTITLPDDKVKGTEEYYASDWIMVNSFEVSDNGDVESLELGAGNYVKLNPGFSASPSTGNLFRAYILSPQDNQIAEMQRITHNVVVSEKLTTEFDNSISEIPDKFQISQNFPNPFNPVTTIKYAIPFDSDVSIKVYNMLGKEVANLVSGDKQAGYYQVSFDASNIASGIYFYRIIAGDFIKTYKMVIVK